MTLHRRHFLGATGAFALLGGCSAVPMAKPAAASRSLEKIGIQTYTLREALGEDFVGTIQMIKDVGYDYVELNGGDFATRTPAELKQILDDHGLPSPISHVNYDSLANRPEELADLASVLGCDYLILPWISDDQRALDQYKGHAEMLNRAGETLKASGIQVGYHNHQFEFFDLGDGETGMNILLSETDPELVTFELDLFWAALTGTDIVGLFEQNPGRFKMCHVKDLSGDAAPYRNSLDFPAIVQALMANVGEGDLPFETYFAAKDVAGLEYFIAEHDNPPRPFQQSVATSYETMRAMRF
ncbi:MAG: sugar phosphate isomerase/epimerase [Hyphomonadaceae bacterium]|nr:sugar phosphate isomerase/epimerase [Hyphomonadaceae bacterium]